MIVVITFILAMLGMVYIAMNQTNEMFDSNYYEKEMQYQNIIEASKNLNNLNEPLSISQNKDSLFMQLPSSLASVESVGNIYFLKVDDAKKDFQQKFAIINTSHLAITKNKLYSGQYTLRVEFLNNRIPYYYEKKITITK